jgi:hypothetical protein
VVSNTFYFPFHIWDAILPIDELIFFRGVGWKHQPDTIWLFNIARENGP